VGAKSIKTVDGKLFAQWLKSNNEQMSKSADLGSVPLANLLHDFDRVSGVMELTDSPISL